MKLPSAQVKTILPIILSLCCASISLAQETKSNSVDTNYVELFPDFINWRLYLSRKYANLEVSQENGGNKLDYNPNSNVNFGAGITVKSFTLNLGYGFNFLNDDRKDRGETRHLDLQTHIYKRKYVVDLFGQIYNGLYLSNTSAITNVPLDSSLNNLYYVRPDVDIRLFSFNALKVYNSEHFSYAAPFVQNERQKKSAGSFLLGAKGYYAFTSADSSYLPYFVVDSIYGDLDSAKELSTFQLGPSIGYAHSFIIKERFFVTAALTMAITTGPVQFTLLDDTEESEWQVNSSLTARLAVGYNSENGYFGVTFLQDGHQLKSFDETARAIIFGGNVRVNYVRRIRMGKKLKQTIDKLPI